MRVHSSFFNCMCVFAVVEMTPPAIANISWRVFIIFAVLNALWVPLVYAFFPETKGLELEDIDHIFENGGITGGGRQGRTEEGQLRDIEPGKMWRWWSRKMIRGRCTRKQFKKV